MYPLYHMICTPFLYCSSIEDIPDEEAALQLAAPAVAVAANQAKLVGHTAPLLPTPPSMTTIAAAAAAAGMGSGLAGAVPAMAAALASSVGKLFVCSLVCVSCLWCVGKVQMMVCVGMVVCFV